MYRVYLTAFAIAVLIFDLCVFCRTMRNLRKDQPELAVWRIQFKACQSFADRKLAEIAILHAECAVAIWFFDLLDNGLLSEAEYNNLTKEMGFCDG